MEDSGVMGAVMCGLVWTSPESVGPLFGAKQSEKCVHIKLVRKR